MENSEEDKLNYDLKEYKNYDAIKQKNIRQRVI